MSLIINQSDNSDIPDQPEYGKKWKPEFNHGCCPDCKKELPPVCTTLIQVFTRSSQDPSLVTTVTNDYCRCQKEAPVSGCQQPPDSIDCNK
jgi:hypothetical protein